MIINLLVKKGYSIWKTVIIKVNGMSVGHGSDNSTFQGIFVQVSLDISLVILSLKNCACVYYQIIYSPVNSTQELAKCLLKHRSFVFRDFALVWVEWQHL